MGAIPLPPGLVRGIAIAAVVLAPALGDARAQSGPPDASEVREQLRKLKDAIEGWPDATPEQRAELIDRASDRLDSVLQRTTLQQRIRGAAFLADNSRPREREEAVRLVSAARERLEPERRELLGRVLVRLVGERVARRIRQKYHEAVSPS